MGERSRGHGADIRRALRSGKLPTEHFDERFSDENLDFWVPLLVEAARIGEGDDVLDVGCGTGGFAREIARRTRAAVTGCDEAEHFIAFARQVSSAERLQWVVGDAAALPLAATSFDRVLLSLILHQLSDPFAAVEEAYRVLRAGGVVLVRSISPDDAPNRVPERYVAAMADADAARLPPIETICGWLSAAGFSEVTATVHERNKAIDVDVEERALRAEVGARYVFVSPAELEDGVRRMRAEASRQRGPLIDPRPTYVITAVKPPDAL